MDSKPLLFRLRSNPAVIWVLRVQFAVLILAATYSCLTSRPEEIIPFHIWDKGIHFFGWFGIFVSLRVAMLGVGRMKESAIGLFAYSSLLEVLQSWVPGRQFEAYDLIANGLGVFVGWMFVFAVMRIQWLRAAWCEPTQ